MDISRDSSNENTVLFQEGSKRETDVFNTKDNRQQLKDENYRYLMSLVNSYCSLKTK